MNLCFVTFQKGFELFKKDKTKGLPFEKCNVVNIRKLLDRGLWTTSLSERLPEIHYFKFFQYSENKFPGLSTIRALKKNINLSEDYSYFLADFMTFDGKKVVGYANISEEETKILAEEICKTFDYFSFEVVNPGQILTWFPGNYPYRNLAFPYQIISRQYTEFLPKEGSLRTIIRIMENSNRLLEKHPVNKVRIDLGENPANFLWFHSQNKKVENIQKISEKTKLKALFWSNTKTLYDIAKFIGFSFIERISFENEKDCFLWIDLQPPGDNLIDIIHTFEFIDREIILPFAETFEKFIIEFNSGFDKNISHTLNFLYSNKKFNILKKLLFKKNPGKFLFENG